MSILGNIREQEKALIGKRIFLEHMDDMDPVQEGSTGTIVNINPFGDYEILWDNGRKLNVIPGEDRFRILD